MSMLPYEPRPREIGDGWRSVGLDELLEERDELWDMDAAEWRPVGWPACWGKTARVFDCDWRGKPHVRRRKA